MALFSEDDRRRIAAKVREVETHTAGEVVVASVARSADYTDIRLGHAALLSLVTAALVHAVWPALDTDWVLLLQLPLCAMHFLVLGTPRLLRALIPKALRLSATEERAKRLFTERGVFDTRDHSGVLIMLSELERRVVMIGDRGINARVQTDGWERHVSHIVQAIRAGRAADGVCEVLDDVGAVLAEVFPQREHDENELPDAVVQEND